MKHHLLAPAIFSAALLIFALPALAGPAINIRTEKGGKLLLVVDDEAVRAEAGGKPLLVIDGPSIFKEKGGQRLFFIDGDILHAYAPEGAVVGYIDGRQLRNKPQGSETLYIDGPIIRKPNLKGDPIYWIDDHAVLNNQQLMAALYTLRPELFDMPKVPAVAAPAAKVAESSSVTPAPATDKPAAATAAKEYEGGTYSIASFKSSDGAKRTGTVTVKKQGAIFAMEFRLAGAEAMQGVAMAQGNELWAAVGTPNTVGLAIYKIDGDNLSGSWLNATGDGSTFGSETLDGGKKIAGPHAITSAKAPFTGAAYAGKVEIDPVAKLALGGDAQAYHFAWELPAYKAQGVGFATADSVAAATSTLPEVAIVRFKIDPASGSLTGDFHTLARVSGTYSLHRDGD